jgi:hypothetical protein
VKIAGQIFNSAPNRLREKLAMTEENKPVPTPENGSDAVHTGEGSSDSSNFQPTIDTNHAGATEALSLIHI